MTPDTPVVVLAVVEVRPEAQDEALAALQELVSDTHAEDGCVRYALHRDTTQPNRFIFVEQWASQAALDAHAERPHARVDSVVAGAPAIYVTRAVPAGDPGKGAL